MDGVDEHQHQLQHCNTRRRTFWCWRRRHGRSRSSSAMDGRQIWTATMLKLIVLVTVAVLFTPSPATVNGQDLLLLRPPKGLMARLNAASMTNDNEAVAAAAAPSSLTECPELCSCLDSYVMCTKLNLLNVTQAGGIPKWVETLDLSGNRLTDTMDRDLVHLESLRELKLNKNRLETIPTFVGLWGVERLSVSHNRIDRIEARSLAALPRLEHLDLSRNKLKVIATNSFPAGTAVPLQTLNLNYNQIGQIQAHALDPLTQLNELKLNHNVLSVLTADLFLHLNSLKRLQLNGNRFERIAGLTFKHLTDLRQLKLRNNRIHQLMDAAFHGPINMTTLELDNNEITTISKSWLYNLTSLHTLSLSNNSIDTVETDSWEFVLRLHTLELSNNRLETIGRTTFEGLPYLKELWLKNNGIKSITSASFGYITELEVLDLSDNSISWAVEDLKSPFVSLGQLRRFYLSGNKIKSINQKAFAELGLLEELDLSNNNVTTIQNNAFRDLVRLRRLLIDSRTLLCDCELEWFHNWLWGLRNTESIVLERLNPVCHYPVWLRGKLLMELEGDNFTCNDSPKPVIIEEPPKKMQALKGSDLRLTCTATSTSTSPMTFQWKRDNAELSGALYETQVLHNRTEEDNSTVASSVLVLENVGRSHVGTYQCVVTNNYGSTYSIKNKISVGILPGFKKIPQNVTVSAGETIRLDCGGTGEPRPQIAWLKDGGNDFPAARERRMHVMPQDDAFFITNAKIIDQGIYSCIATNDVGDARANATVAVLDAPTFTHPMAERKEVFVGATSVIECLVIGSPKPELHWLKDGEQLEYNEPRHYFTADHQILVIVESEEADSGLYECHVTNALGEARGEMQLEVMALPPPQILVKAGQIVELGTLPLAIIITVCSVVGTSVIWFVIVFCIRRKQQQRRTCTHHHRGEMQEQEEQSGQMLCTAKTMRSEFYGTNKKVEHRLVEEYPLDMVGGSCKDSGNGDSSKGHEEDEDEFEGGGNGVGVVARTEADENRLNNERNSLLWVNAADRAGGAEDSRLGDSVSLSGAGPDQQQKSSIDRDGSEIETSAVFNHSNNTNNSNNSNNSSNYLSRHSNNSSLLNQSGLSNNIVPSCTSSFKRGATAVVNNGPRPMLNDSNGLPNVVTYVTT